MQRRFRRVLQLGRAVQLVGKSAPGWTLASAALVLVQGTLPLVSLYLVKCVVDAVIVAAPSAGAGPGPSLRSVALLIAGLGAATLLGGLASSLAAWITEAQAQSVTDHVQDILHAHSVTMDLAYYESPEYHDSLHRAQREAPHRPTRIVGGLVHLARGGLTLTLVAALVVALHWGVALLLLVAALPAVYVRLRHANRLHRRQRERTPQERMAHYLHALLTTTPSAKEVRLFGLGPLLMERYRRVARDLRLDRLELSRHRTVADLVAQTCAALALCGAYVFIAHRVLHGALSAGDLVLYYQAFQRGQAELRDVLGALAGLYEDSLFLQNFYDFLELKPRVTEPAAPIPLPPAPRQGLVFDRVGFRYPDAPRRVLEDITFTLRPGEHVALVGENGSGKTTLVKLLCRLYDPSDGAIRLDGVDLREYRSADWRRRIGAVFQDPVQYQLSARDNIAFGDAERTLDDGRLRAAAESAGADGLIGRLPQGYDSLLGASFLTGSELSLGEWQKIALARAFARDAPLLILDEPSSALDARAECELFDKFRRLAEGRTAVLISHRLSSVKTADCIYVLDRGRLVERGRHEELLQAGGVYAQLFELQAARYR